MFAVQVEDLPMSAAHFAGEERARQSFICLVYCQDKGSTLNQAASNEWTVHTKRLFAGVPGVSSVRTVVKATIEGREMQVKNVVWIVDKAPEAL